MSHLTSSDASFYKLTSLNRNWKFLYTPDLAVNPGYEHWILPKSTTYLRSFSWIWPIKGNHCYLALKQFSMYSKKGSSSAFDSIWILNIAKHTLTRAKANETENSFSLFFMISGVWNTSSCIKSCIKVKGTE